jgi:hypothetical protein
MPRFDLNDYVTVQERIVQFWKDHPDGAIRTQLESPSDCFDTCRYSAAVFVDRANPGPDATGWAVEKIAPPGDRGPNVTSHEENCETSAIGRALANLGYATSQKDRPSREEMRKVVDAESGEVQAPRQAAPARSGGGPSDKQFGLIRHLIRSLNLSEEQLNMYVEKEYKAPLDALPGRDVSNLIDRLKAKVDSLATEPQAEDF